ncbi:CHAT domain-containing protein [Bradyrhizobium diazoefficiens]
MFAILKRQALRKQGGASEEEFRKIDRDIFDLVQERELDRVGVAIERGMLRRTNEETIRRLQQSLAELCAARSAFDDAVKSRRPNLDSSVERLNRARAAMAESERTIQSDVRLKFATGRLKVSMEDLPDILRDREAMIAFRVGSDFSVVFIAARRGANVITASALSKTASRGDIAAAVTSVIDARRQGDFRAATDRLGTVLGLEDLKGLFEGTDHIFLVADGDLQRLPAHLLPIGSTLLGDLSATSTLSSLSMLAALRNPAVADKQPSRSSSGFGDPMLDDSGCPKPDASEPRQLVNCLGKAYGSAALLQATFAMFGGAAPQTGINATVQTFRKADLSKAAVLVLATHGLVGGDKLSKLPAIVLTPDPSDPKDSGLFTTADIADMDLDGVSLAIIAACHTAGAAPDSLEEGLSGLGLAFATAGAKALILSYWDAEPSATEKLLEQALTLMNRDHLSVAAALTASMSELRKNRYTPEQWAPFVVIGDGTVKIPEQ